MAPGKWDPTKRERDSNKKKHSTKGPIKLPPPPKVTTTNMWSGESLINWKGNDIIIYADPCPTTYKAGLVRRWQSPGEILWNLNILSSYRLGISISDFLHPLQKVRRDSVAVWGSWTEKNVGFKILKTGNIKTRYPRQNLQMEHLNLQHFYPSIIILCFVT